MNFNNILLLVQCIRNISISTGTIQKLLRRYFILFSIILHNLLCILHLQHISVWNGPSESGGWELMDQVGLEGGGWEVAGSRVSPLSWWLRVD